jgi:hypothetical protein
MALKRLVVAQDRIGVDVEGLAVELAEAGLDRARGERPRHLRQGALDMLGHVRRHRDHRGDPVVDRQVEVGLAELLHQAVDLDLVAAAGQRRFQHLLEALAHEGGAPVELVDQPLPLLGDLQVGEDPDDHQRGDPERNDQPELEPHAGLSAATPSASRARSWCTSETSCSRYAAFDAGTASPTRMVSATSLSTEKACSSVQSSPR